VRVNDLTVEILKQIRDGVDNLGSSLGERIDRLGERVDHLETSLGERIDGTNQRLDRVEQGMLDLGKFMRQIARDQSRHERFHHKHVDVLEKDVDDLKARVSKLEKRRGS
jgi:polyhydroxyalkanoate synthesis regulator phasin